MDVDSTYEERFILRMRRVRKLRGITQPALAEATGIPSAVVANIETGRRRFGVTLSEAAAICAALGVELIEMLSPEPMKLRSETAVD